MTGEWEKGKKRQRERKTRREGKKKKNLLKNYAIKSATGALKHPK